MAVAFHTPPLHSVGSSRGSTPAGHTCAICAECGAVEGARRNSLRVYGLVTSLAYQRARLCVEKLRKYLSSSFEEPFVKGMLEFDWDEYLTSERRKHGGRLWAARNGVLVWDGSYFVGDDWDLLLYISPDVVFNLPENSAHYFFRMVNDYSTFLSKPERIFVTMDLLIGKIPLGSLMFELYTDMLPLTCGNFINLCEGFPDPQGHVYCYKGSCVHRIVRDGWLQCGDVTRTSGGGGHSALGPRTFQDENHSVPHDRRGVLSMCNKGPDSNQSQFFITLAPAEWMNTAYVAFGRVVEGSQVMSALENMKTLYETPVVPVMIADCAVLDLLTPMGRLPPLLEPQKDIGPPPVPGLPPEWQDEGEGAETPVMPVVPSVIDVRDVDSILCEERFLQGLYSLTVPEAVVWRAFDISREQLDEEMAQHLLMMLARRAVAEDAIMPTRDEPPPVVSTITLAYRVAEETMEKLLKEDDEEAHKVLGDFGLWSARVGSELLDVLKKACGTTKHRASAMRIARDLVGAMERRAEGAPPGQYEEALRMARDVLEEVQGGAAGHAQQLAQDMLMQLAGLAPGGSPGDSPGADEAGQYGTDRTSAYSVVHDAVNKVVGRMSAYGFAQDMLQQMGAEAVADPLTAVRELLYEAEARAMGELPAEPARDIAKDLLNLAERRAMGSVEWPYAQAARIAHDILSEVERRATDGPLGGPLAPSQSFIDAELFDAFLGENYAPGRDAMLVYSALIASEILKEAASKGRAEELRQRPSVGLFAVGDMRNEDPRVARKAREILDGALTLVAEVQRAAADVAFKHDVRTALPPSHRNYLPGEVEPPLSRPVPQEYFDQEAPQQQARQLYREAKEKPLSYAVYRPSKDVPPPKQGDEPTYYHPGFTGVNV